MQQVKISEKPPLLSVVLIVGGCRERAQRCLHALGQQTAMDYVEVILFDIAGAPRLSTPTGLQVQYVLPDTPLSFSAARARGVRLAKGKVVAYLEEHCVPEAGWAEALIAAHDSDCAAVGYRFRNANPESYVSRAFMVGYGMSLYVSRPTRVTTLPAHNISYKRELLLECGDQLELLLTPDCNIQRVFAQRGHTMLLEPRAVVEHENLTRILSMARTHAAFSRLFAARRATVGRWRPARRLLYALACPMASPVLGLCRLMLPFLSKPLFWFQVIVSLPVQAVAHLFGGVAESLGYLFGEGQAERELSRMELSVIRRESC